MALKKVAGPYEFKDLFGEYHPVTPYIWCNELDGYLAKSDWRRSPSGSWTGSPSGFGVLQMDGTFTPRQANSYPYSLGDGIGFIYYDLAKRQLAFQVSQYPDYYFARGVDWFSLIEPYNPETVPLVSWASDGVHGVDPYVRAFLPDRMLLLGYEIQDQFDFSTPVVKIFSLAYGATTHPVVEHVIQTSVEPGSEDWEDWKPTSLNTKFIQSGTPERTIFLVRMDPNDCRALEYDYIAKKVVGWVRRLGVQPDLYYYESSPAPGQTKPFIIGYSVKHKLWLVKDDIPDPGWGYRRRISHFVDEAVPAFLSSPVGLSPTAAGEAVRYQVRLTGADSDPCIGQKVNWTCSAVGTVLVPQSLTDGNGYAETLVAYPPNAEGPWLGTTITAEVVF